MSDPALVLARLIEYGVAPPSEADWPPVWLYAHACVSAVIGTRGDRMEAFEQAIQDNPDVVQLRLAVLKVLPPREDRGGLNRIIYTAADAFQPPPVQDWCVEGLLARRTLSLLVGDPGSKKTLLALDLAVCLALGKPWLGRPVQQCPVLFIDEETGKPRLWARVHASFLAHGATPESSFNYMSLPNFDLRDPVECDRLLLAVQSVKAGLVVIDALADVIRGSDENSVLAVQPFLLRMRYIAESSHAAVLIIHHNNKSGSFRGSSVISAGVDLMLGIESEAASTLVSLRPLKTRDAAPDPFAARAHFEPGRFYLTPESYQGSQESPVPQHRNATTAILDLLAELGHADTELLLLRLDGLSLGTIRNAIQALKDQGMVERVDGGSRGARATYGLTPKGRGLLTINQTPASGDDY